MERHICSALSEEKNGLIDMISELHRIYEANKLHFMHFNELTQMKPGIIRSLFENKEHLSLVNIQCSP